MVNNTAVHNAYIGLGSNLAQPEQQVRQALHTLARLDTLSLCQHSALYRSKPMGPQNQPHFINAVAQLKTALSPLALLDTLLNIERQQGRVRNGERWGPRILDLDLLLYDDLHLQHPQLTLPHPGLAERNFVLYPLYECAPKLTLPNGQRLTQLLQQCSAAGLHRIDYEPNYYQPSA